MCATCRSSTSRSRSKARGFRTFINSRAVRAGASGFRSRPQHGQELVLRLVGAFGFGPGGVSAADSFVALTRALLEERRRGGERPLQSSGFSDVTVGLPKRPPFGHRLGRHARGREIGRQSPRHDEYRREAAQHQQGAPRQERLHRRAQRLIDGTRGTTTTAVQPWLLRLAYTSTPSRVVSRDRNSGASRMRARNASVAGAPT